MYQQYNVLAKIKVKFGYNLYQNDKLKIKYSLNGIRISRKQPHLCLQRGEF